MVAFRKLFQTERYPSTGVGGQDVGLTTSDSQSDAQSRPSASSQFPVKTARPADGSMDVDRHFQRIERQLEELHDSMQARPTPRVAQIPSRTSSRFAIRNPRHVDLFDAAFSSSQGHQAQQPPRNHPQQHQQHHLPLNNPSNKSPSSASPVSPYNEDVAERNMARSPQKPPRKRSLYSRFISAIHQEDAAVKNMPKGKDGARPRSRSANKSPISPNADNGAKAKENRPPTGLVPREAATRPRSRGVNEPVTSIPRETQPRPHLRSQRSAPNLSTAKLSPSPQKGPERSPDPGPVGHLSVPPAHKQGDSWSSTPLPDSPTLPGQPTATGKHDRSETSAPATKAHSTLVHANPSKPPSSKAPSRPVPSRKNTLNLSINTQVAALGSQPAKPSRAIQPPTPNSNNDTKYNPSIAEVMNSPLPSATPTSVSPLPSSNQKVAEIMDMFKQAYNSTPAKPISPHPTFETLQDAIVREINSHEAFRRLPVPEPGPAFTPSPARESFDRRDSTAKSTKNSSTSVSMNSSGKENQLSKLIKPSPFKKHRRNSETRSISTSVVPAVLGRVSTSGSRRRHTDAPPPSPGFFDEPASQEKDKDEPMPLSPSYEEAPFRSQTVPPGATSTIAKKRSISLSKTHAPSQSVATLASPASSTATAAAAAGPRSVYYMRAQTSPISSDGKTSFSVGDSSDDYSEEDVLHLPSPSLTSSTPQHGHKTKDSPVSASATTPATAKSRWSIFPPKPNATTVSVASLSSSSVQL